MGHRLSSPKSSDSVDGILPQNQRSKVPQGGQVDVRRFTLDVLSIQGRGRALREQSNKESLLYAEQL